jgi:hypothetical protein
MYTNHFVWNDMFMTRMWIKLVYTTCLEDSPLSSLSSCGLLHLFIQRSSLSQPLQIGYILPYKPAGLSVSYAG